MINTTVKIHTITMLKLKLKKVYARMSSLSLTNSLSCHLQQYKHRQETDLANELPHVLGDMWTYRRQDERLGLNEAEHQIAVHPRWLQLTVLVASRLTPTNHNANCHLTDLPRTCLVQNYAGRKLCSPRTSGPSTLLSNLLKAINSFCPLSNNGGRAFSFFGLSAV